MNAEHGCNVGRPRFSTGATGVIRGLVLLDAPSPCEMLDAAIEVQGTEAHVLRDADVGLQMGMPCAVLSNECTGVSSNES